MADFLKLKKSNCKHCYKCIRHCPVKSISFSSDQANILPEECILCGQCFVNCPQNAKEIRSDTDIAKELIAGGAPVYASIAPSFVANYAGVTIESMKKALMRLGFRGVEETAIGATVVKTRYDEMVGEQDVIISSCCHSVNLLIQKYYPGALPYLAAVVSPMQAHCAGLKAAHPGAGTVFIGPCISKKAEAESYPGTVDCVLTFEELSAWLEEEGVPLERMEDHNARSRARLFPTAGGVLRSMRADNPDYSYIAIDGIDNCIGALKDVVNGDLTHCFIEMSACRGSCIGGPVMDRESRAPVKDYITVSACAGEEDFPVDMPEREGLHKDISFIGVNRRLPGSAAIQQVLNKMGKPLPEHELNCGSCGYDTCREKAVAVLLGKADLTMCLPYLKERAETFSDTIIRNTPNGIIVLSESMEVQQINASACRLMNVKAAGDVLGEGVVRLLDPQIFFEVLQNGRNIYGRRMHLAEYQRHAEFTVIHEKSFEILICIMRDVTQEEIQRAQWEELSRKTIEITDKVIEKQMRSVQEIASLLGETTAETKVALTVLKETLHNE